MMEFARNKYKEVFLHFVLWFGYSLMLFYGPSMIMDTNSAIIFSIRTLFINALVFYANAFWLLPKFMARNTYTKYVIGIVFLMICSGFFYHFTELSMRDTDWRRFRRSDKEWIEAIQEDRFITENKDLIYIPEKPRDDTAIFIGRHMRMGLLSSLGMLFISTLFWVIAESRGRKQRELSLVNQNLVNEMRFLKSQMNPHFLFNALNNIYSLAMLHSVKTPDMILKLSAMLRYVLYESEERKVPLGKEVDYIKNFIEFQRVKIEGIPNLHIDIDRVDCNLMIEPMLLIPFVENSFKHSKVEDTENGWVWLTLVNEANLLIFEIRNSVPASKTTAGVHSGIGNENVKRRLNHLYPESHEISISERDQEFSVILKIQLS